MKQLLFIILIAFFSNNSFAANLVSSVDRNKISEDETLNLTITLDDASFSGSPDLAVLDSNFQILNQRSSSSTTIINGAYNSKKQWLYTLLPKKTGKLLIPSFKLNNAFSEAIEIDVLNNNEMNKKNDLDNAAGSAQQGDLFLEQSIDKTEAYVDEQMTLTLRIFTAIQIARPEIPVPSLPGFMVEQLGQAEYQSKRHDRSYYVLEYKYGLFPNKSGTVLLPKQRYQISQIINNGPRSLFNIPEFDQPSTQARFLSTPELTLNIKPQPDNLPAPYWLPSENLVISDNWPDQQSIETGATLTRSIEIKALGNLAAHIPPLPANSVQGLKMYAEQPELNNTHNNDNFLATRKETIAIVPVQPGTYILPAITLHWWDTKNRQFKTSTLPERSLTVNGSAAASHSLATPVAPTQILQPTQVAPIGSALVNPVVDSTAQTPFYKNVYVWMAATIFFSVLWIITLVAMIRRKNTKLANSADFSAAEAARQNSLKDALKQLKTACITNNAKLARTAIIQWAQLQWPDTEIRTLLHVKQQIQDDEFSLLLDNLDESLYASSALWNGKPLLNILVSRKLETDNVKEETLPKLYE
jgi:hypothetical protein